MTRVGHYHGSGFWQIIAAVVPTPLWLAPLALFIPNLYFSMVVMLFALGASAALIYQGVDRVFGLEDEGKTMLVAGSVFAAGLSPGCQ